MTTKPESRLHRKIIRDLKIEYPGSWWMKVHGGPFQMAGVPDILGCVDGLFIALEVKTEDKNKASVIQIAQISRIKKAGGYAGVVVDPKGAILAVRSALAISKNRI